MSSDATMMHNEQSNNKRPIVEIAEIADTEPEEAQQSNKRSAHGETETLWTLRVATTGDTVMSDSETNEANEANEAKRANEANESNDAKRANEANESNETNEANESTESNEALDEIKIYRPSKHEKVVWITAGNKPPFYVSGLGSDEGKKEGLAISAHLDHEKKPDWDTWSAEEIAQRRAEVREVLGAMLANVDELAERTRTYSRDDLREKLAYMLGATWQRFMGVDFPGSGPGTLQCFSSYYTLVRT
jgi:hypothetical protein